MAKKPANKPASKTQPIKNQKQTPAKKTAVKSDSANLKSNANWKVIECPTCGDRKPPEMLDDSTARKWHLHCEQCGEMWRLNLTSGKITRDAKVQPKPEVLKPFQPHVTRGIGAEELKILDRQNLVMDLKIAGMSFRKIQEHLNKKGYDVSLGTVHSDYVASLERLQKINIDKTELLVIQELEKIEDWELTLSVAAKGRKLTVNEAATAIGAFTQLQNQRDKFLAVSKPKVIEIKNITEFANALGIKPEDLPDVDETAD